MSTVMFEPVVEGRFVLWERTEVTEVTEDEEPGTVTITKTTVPPDDPVMTVVLMKLEGRPVALEI